MNMIGFYVLRRSLKPFLFIIVLALTLLLIERALRLLDQVLGNSGSFVALLEMLAFLIPHYMALALPAGFYLGILLTFNAMHERYELDALNSAGVGLFEMMRPLLVFSLGLAIFTALNASYAQPYARYVYRSLVHFVAESSINGYLRERTAIEVGRYTFLADQIRPADRRYTKLFVYEETRDGATIAMTAERAHLSGTDEARRMILTLENGVRMTTGPTLADGGHDARSGSDKAVFERVEVPITLDRQDEFRPRGQDERELTFLELWRLRDAPPIKATPAEMIAELNNHLVRAISVFFLPFMAVGLALGPRRVHRAYNIAIGFAVIIIYNELLDIGKISTSQGNLSPFVNQWLPLTLFVSASFFVFLKAFLRVPSGEHLPALYVWIANLGRLAWSAVRVQARG